MKYAVIFAMSTAGLVASAFVKPYSESTDELTNEGFDVAKAGFETADDARKFGNLYLGTDGQIPEEAPATDSENPNSTQGMTDHH